MTNRENRLSDRRIAREEALNFLYELEVTGDALETLLVAKPLPPRDYALELVQGVTSCTAELDHVIGTHLRDWTVGRLALLDRLLARLATWELLKRDEVPTGVVLSEVVELATQYCGAESPRFLNGLLRAVAIEIRGTEIRGTEIRGTENG